MEMAGARRWWRPPAVLCPACLSRPTDRPMPPPDWPPWQFWAEATHAPMLFWAEAAYGILSGRAWAWYVDDNNRESVVSLATLLAGVIGIPLLAIRTFAANRPRTHLWSKQKRPTSLLRQLWNRRKQLWSRRKRPPRGTKNKLRPIESAGSPKAWPKPASSSAAAISKPA